MSPTYPRRPTGLVATCQCGKVVGAMDLSRTQRGDASELLGAWFSRGCAVARRFESSWSVSIEPCACCTPEAA